MNSKQSISATLTFSLAFFLAACANPMEPAKNALDNININLSSVSADAQKYVPDQFAQAQTHIAALTASFVKKDYPAVVAGAPAVLAEVRGLAGAATTKRDDTLKALGADWRKLEASVPQSISAVQSRVDSLSKSKHIPKGIDIGAAKSELADATSGWDKAQQAFKSGSPGDAVTAAKDAQGKLTSAAEALKLNLTQ